MKKGITVEQAVEAVAAAKRAGIRYVECDFMLGAHVDETLETSPPRPPWLIGLGRDFLAVSIIVPVSGTGFYGHDVRPLLASPPDWSQFTHFGLLHAMSADAPG